MPIAVDVATEDFSSTAISSEYPPLHYFRVPNIPPAAYYIPDFVTPEEEQTILRKIQESPQPKWKTVGTGRRLQYWGGNLSKKGILLPELLPEWLTSFPDIVGRIEDFLRASLPKSAEEQDGRGVNQVLVNEYQPDQGISPHEDGPAFKPLVATLSLGSHTILDIHQYLSTTAPSPPMIAVATDDPDQEGKPIAAIPLAHLLLLPRSLLILTSSLYTSHLHGIQPGPRDIIDGPSDIANFDVLGDASVMDEIRDGFWAGNRSGPRTSLTFRSAKKVLKGGSFGLMNGNVKRG